jgi:hypothetical protein
MTHKAFGQKSVNKKHRIRVMLDADDEFLPSLHSTRELKQAAQL